MDKIDNNLSKISNETFYNKISCGRGVFIDIETTGLKKDSCSIYLIGLLYPVSGRDSDKCRLSLLFAEDPGEEAEILSGLKDILEDSSCSLITFNGRRFDLPFLIKRFEKYDITPPACLSDGSDIDIYAALKPFRRSFGMSSLNQKSVEKMLGISREDRYSGGELIDVYFEYVKSRDPSLKELLLIHNRDDVLGMTEILPVLTYAAIFTGSCEEEPFTIKNAFTESHLSFDGNESSEFIIEFMLPSPVPKPRLFHNLRLFLETSGDTGILRIPLFKGELKHFFTNYRDYCYIPSEDKAVLKEIAALMDRDKTEKAKKTNCYIRAEGLFLPLPSGFSFPDISVFKQDYNSKTGYAMFSDEIKYSPGLGEYLMSILTNSFL